MSWIICLKRKYDKKGAQTALNNILSRLKRHENRRETRIYHCPLCNAWHLTSKDYEPYEEDNFTPLLEFKKYLVD